MPKLISSERAYEIITGWGSYIHSGDPGACFYGFSVNDARPQDQAHREQCITYLESLLSSTTLPNIRRQELNSVKRWFKSCPSKELTFDELYALANHTKKGLRHGFRWFTSSSGAVEMVINISDVSNGYHQGDCDASILELVDVPYIKMQLDKFFAPDKVEATREELRETFFDSDNDPECLDDENNRKRLLWIACADISENDEED